MKRLHTGVILLDTVDIICIGFSIGSTCAYGVKLYRKYKRKKNNNEDPIITELKRTSPIMMVSESGKPLKLPLMRGGDRIRGYSLLIKNKKLAKILSAILTANKNKKNLSLLKEVLFWLNQLLTVSTGLRIAVGGSLSYTQILLIAFPSTIGGYLMAMTYAYPYPLASALIPIAILFGRGIEDIPDPYKRCRMICQAAEEYHNKQLKIEMQNLNSLIQEASDALQLPLDQQPLLCVEEKLSLVQRFQLKGRIKSKKVRKRVVYFNEFIKKFPECKPKPEDIYQEIVEKIPEKVKNY